MSRLFQGLEWAENPSLSVLFDAVAEWPAGRRALDKVAQIKSAREVATDENKDRLFGRGSYARA